MSDADAARVPSLYQAHLATLGSRLPKEARRLCAEVSLHDGLVRAVEHADHRLEVVFRAGENERGYFDARLSYRGVVLSDPDEQVLRNAVGRRDVELLADEFDAAADRWVHRLLFRPYREAVVYFDALTVTVTPALGRFDQSQITEE